MWAMIPRFRVRERRSRSGGTFTCLGSRTGVAAWGLGSGRVAAAEDMDGDSGREDPRLPAQLLDKGARRPSRGASAIYVKKITPPYDQPSGRSREGSIRVRRAKKVAEAGPESRPTPEGPRFGRRPPPS